MIKARHFVSKCVLDAQASHIQSGRYRLVEKGMLYNILIMMFDETELDVCLGQVGAASWSILASHSQLSIHAAGHDLRPGFVGSDAKFSAVLINGDRHPANIRLLKHLHTVVPRNVFVFPSLCAQHRNGNVIERATKHLGILPGSFCVAKSTGRGKFLIDLRNAVERTLAQNLLVRAGKNICI